MENLYAVAEELLALGRPETALAELTSLVAGRFGGAESLLRRGGLLLQLGRLDNAYSDLQEAALADPENGWTHLRLAQVASRLGKMWIAARHADDAVLQLPDSTEIRLEAALIYTALGWLDRAFIVVMPTPRDMSGWGGEIRGNAVLAYKRRRTQTTRHLELRRLKPSPVDFDLATSLFSLGRTGPALRACESLMRAAPESDLSFRLYAAVIARQHGTREAASRLRGMNFLYRGSPRHQELIDFLDGQASCQLSPAGLDSATFMNSMQLLGSS